MAAGAYEPVVIRKLRDLDAIADPVEKRRAMLDRLDQIRELAESRSYVNKRGEQVTNPDTSTMLAVDQFATELTGVERASGANGAAVGKLAGLSIFKKVG